MKASGQGLFRKPLLAVEPQANHPDAPALKKLQQPGAKLHRLRQAGGIISPRLVKPGQLGPRQHHCGVDAHRLRPQLRQAKAGAPVQLRAAFIKAGHHLEAQGKPRLPDAPGRPADLLPGVAPAVGLQYLIIQGLGPQLNSPDPVIP